MSIDTDERFAAELSGQLHRIATGLTPGQEIETAVGVRAAARTRRRTVARATAGVGVVLLVVAGIGWVGTRPTEPAEPTNPSGFSAPDVVYPVIDEALLPTDLRGQLRPEVSTTDPGQWVGGVVPASDSGIDSLVIVAVAPSSDSSWPNGDTPRRADVTEASASDRGTLLSLRRDGFDVRLVSFDVDFAYTLVDRIVPSATGFELIDDATAPTAAWLTRPYEVPPRSASLYSDELNALDITIEQMPINFARRFLCTPPATSTATCEGSTSAAILVELDATHTLVVSSNQLTTFQLDAIAADVRFVTFDQWNSDGLPAPTTVEPIDPDAIWPLLDESAVPDRLSPAEPDLSWWPSEAYFGSVGNLVDDGTSPQATTTIALHPRADEERPDAVPGRTEGVTESKLGDATALTKSVGEGWELTIISNDLDQSYAVLGAIDVAFDENGEVIGYGLSRLPEGLREFSPGVFVPAGSSPRLGVGDTSPITIQTVPLPLQTALGMQLTPLQGNRTSAATTINGRDGFLIEGLPAGARQLIIAVTPKDTLIVTASGEITLDELLAVAHGISFGTQAEWEALYGVTVRELEQEMPTTTEPG